MPDVPTVEAGVRSLEVHYQLTQDDVVQVTLLVYPRAGWLRGLLIAAICAFVCFLLTAPALNSDALYLLALLPPAAIFIAVLLTMSPNRMRKRVRELVAKDVNDVSLMPGVTRVGESGVDIESHYFALHYSWMAILKVEQTADYLLFYLHARSPHAVPKRCFESPAVAEAFFELARRYCPQAPRCTKCGYDLRGNRTGTCPECGQQAQASPERGN